MCNEPDRERIKPEDLLQHYVECCAAIRCAGMCASRVSVVCPLYYEGPYYTTFVKLWSERCFNSGEPV